MTAKAKPWQSELEWRRNSVTVAGQQHDFYYNIMTGTVRAPGIVEFITYSLDDARTILAGLYHPKAYQ